MKRLALARGTGPCLARRRGIASWRYLPDGGLETDLIFHYGVDLPEFAAYPLLWGVSG